VAFSASLENILDIARKGYQHRRYGIVLSASARTVRTYDDYGVL